MRRATLRYARLFEVARRCNEEHKFWDDLKADCEKKVVCNDDFSIRELFERFVLDSHGDPAGREIIESWKNAGIGEGHNLAKLTEAAGAVQKSAFSNITGQIVYNETLAAWNQPQYLADQLTTNVPTGFLDGERIAGISVVGDDAEVVGEAQPYPYSGLSEQYVDTPAPLKRGHIVSLTRESIIADRTGDLRARANTVTNSLRINKEKRVLDVVLGVTTTWKRNGEAATATYAASGSKPHDFNNLLGTTPLTDWVDVEAALMLFDGMTDPDIGEPIVVTATTLLVPSALKATAVRILNATEVRMGTGDAFGADPTDNIEIFTNGPNPLNGSGLTIATNPFVSTRLNATDWFVGEPAKAFRYMEVWPITAIQAPVNSEMEFTRDIVEQFKISEYGVPAVVEPRYMVWGDAA